MTRQFACVSCVLSAACGGEGDPRPDASLVTVPNGFINIFHHLQPDTPLPGIDQRSGISAIFFSGDRSVVAQRVVGPCVVSTSGASFRASPVSAGTLTLVGGGLTSTLQFQNSGYGIDQTEPVFPNGTEITVSAAGDVVPAFSESFTYPAAFVVEDPPRSELERLAISKSAGFTASWIGTQAVEIEVAVIGVAEIRCRYEGVSSGEVPPAALADLSVGDVATIVVSVTETRVFEVGEFQIEMTIVDGTLNSGNVQP